MRNTLDQRSTPCHTPPQLWSNRRLHKYFYRPWSCTLSQEGNAFQGVDLFHNERLRQRTVKRFTGWNFMRRSFVCLLSTYCLACSPVIPQIMIPLAVEPRTAFVVVVKATFTFGQTSPTSTSSRSYRSVQRPLLVTRIDTIPNVHVGPPCFSGQTQSP
jgi:hypothetical protein